MNRYLLILLLAIIGMIPVSAQSSKDKGTPPPPPSAEMRTKITDFKIKYLAKEMELNDEQKETFSKLYTEMTEEKHKVFEEMRVADKKVRKNEAATEADYKELNAKTKASMDKVRLIDEKYDARFRKFLSDKQIYEMRRGEEKFREKMQEMRQKNRGKHHKEGKDKKDKKK